MRLRYLCSVAVARIQRQMMTQHLSRGHPMVHCLTLICEHKLKLLVIIHHVVVNIKYHATLVLV